MAGTGKRNPPASFKGNEGDILLYQTEDGATRLEVRFVDESVWLSQAQMAELFQTTKQNVSLHIRNLFEEGELRREATVKDSLTVRQEGKRSVQRQVELFNLDVIMDYCESCCLRQRQTFIQRHK